MANTIPESVMRTLDDVLGADMLHLGISSALLGSLFHASILRTLEVDNFMYTLIYIIFLVFLGLSSAYITLGFTLFETITRVALVFTSFHTGLFTSLVLYRLFFHRLHKFPGPVGAKVSRFYSVSKTVKNVTYYRELAEMHEQYGDFIRTGPRELAVVRRSAVPLLYGPNSKCLKSTWYMQVSSDHRKCSIHMTRDFNDHRIRKKAWDKGFSVKALSTYEPRIKNKADLFVSRIAERCGQPLDGTAWGVMLAFDIMGEVGFSKDFRGVADGKQNPAIKAIHDHMTILGIMSHVPWLLNMLSRIPGAASAYSEFFGWCTNEIEEKRQHWDPSAYPQDLVSWLLKAYIEKDTSAPPSEEALHQDSRVIVIAGSETTATTLASVLFFLAKCPEVQKTLQKKVDMAFPKRSDWTYDKVKRITYIDDIINETLRLKPALLTGGFRVTPPEGLQVDEQFIPGDTNVFVPVYQIHTDPRYWQNALEFIPERWGDRKAQMDTEAAPFMPFSGTGAYSCPGKNLAMLSVRITLSRIAQEFDVSFAEGETGERFDTEAKDTFTAHLPAVMLNFSPRR